MSSQPSTTTAANLAAPRRPQLTSSASAPLINTTTTTTDTYPPSIPEDYPTKDDTFIPHNPHMLVIASHTAYRSPARTPSSILSKSASWINTSKSVDLSPNGSRAASPRSGRSPVGTPVGTPRSRSPVRDEGGEEGGEATAERRDEEGADEAPEWVGRGWGEDGKRGVVEVEGELEV